MTCIIQHPSILASNSSVENWMRRTKMPIYFLLKAIVNRAFHFHNHAPQLSISKRQSSWKLSVWQLLFLGSKNAFSGVVPEWVVAMHLVVSGLHRSRPCDCMIQSSTESARKVPSPFESGGFNTLRAGFITQNHSGRFQSLSPFGSSYTVSQVLCVMSRSFLFVFCNNFVLSLWAHFLMSGTQFRNVCPFESKRFRQKGCCTLLAIICL